VATRRLTSAKALIRQKSRAFRQCLVGRDTNVLVEETGPDGQSFGFGEHYVRVYFKGHKNLEGRFALVNLTGLHKDGLEGRVLEAAP
jgi:tRNA A37 methylthiotransferase MiaB